MYELGSAFKSQRVPIFTSISLPTYLFSPRPVAHKANTRPFHLFLAAAIFSDSFQVFPIYFRSPSIVLLRVSLGLPRLLFSSAGVFVIFMGQ